MKSQNRDVRPLLIRALSDFQKSAATQAVDFGCGHGIETAYLAHSKSWSVLAIDSNPMALASAMEKVKGSAQDSVNFLNSSFETIFDLPLCDFLYCYHSIHFVSKEHYERLWTLLTRSVKLNGRLVISVFGENDAMVKRKQAIGITEKELLKKLNGF